MPNFQYKALDSGGVLDTGTIQAGSRPDAFDKIKQLGLQLVQLEETAEEVGRGAKSGGISLPWKQTRVSFKVLGNFTRLLSSLLAAGVPLSKALTILYRETTDPAASKKWREVHDLVIDGVSLSDAMFTPQWWRPAKREDFSTWCWRRLPNSRHGIRSFEAKCYPR